MTALAAGLRRLTQAENARTYSPAATLLFLAPLGLLLLGVFFVPIALLLLRSLTEPAPGLDHYARLVSEPLYLTILLRTLRVALLVTLIDLALGYPLAYLMTRLTGRWAIVVAALVVLPLWTSVLVRSYAWTVLFQRNGVINNALQGLGLTEAPLTLLYTEPALLVAMSHVLLPFMVLPLYAALRGIDADLPRAARSLGAGDLAVFRQVIWPLGLPGVAAGALLTFILALGFYITPALVGGPQTMMIATLIGQQATLLSNLPFAGALSAVLLVLTVGLVLAFNRTLRLGRVISDAG